MDIRPYKSELQTEWDTFVRNSKNGTFLFCRSFMEYHSNRYTDLSLMFYQKGKLMGLIPGNVSENTFYSHAGLTYGGLALSQSAKMKQVKEIFCSMTGYLKEKGINKIIYKAIPHIYHKYPSEEDLYMLFRMNASLISRSISSSILLSEKAGYSKLRKRCVEKAGKNDIGIHQTDSLELFWPILEDNLKTRYKVSPVHSLEEIKYLKKAFADEIRLYCACTGQGDIVAGCLIFVTDTVVHIQYVAASKEGRLSGAVDLLINHIIHAYPDKKYFDYGISTENGGQYLNANLIAQKEGFGARGIVYDIYSVDL